MGTTPTYSWPYPEPTDPVANGAQDIEDLALAVESTVSGITGGKILQVVSTTKTDTFSASVAGFAFTSNVTGLEVTITPSSTASEILIHAVVQASQATDYSYTEWRLMRGTTAIAIGDAVGSRAQVTAVGGAYGNELNDQSNTSGVFLDSPNTTSPITYGIQLKNRAATTRGIYVNRSAQDTNSVAIGRSVSTIMAMEVSA